MSLSKTLYPLLSTGPEVIKLFVLNSTEHKIYHAHKLLAF